MLYKVGNNSMNKIAESFSKGKLLWNKFNEERKFNFGNLHIFFPQKFTDIWFEINDCLKSIQKKKKTNISYI